MLTVVPSVEFPRPDADQPRCFFQSTYGTDEFPEGHTGRPWMPLGSRRRRNAATRHSFTSTPNQAQAFPRHLNERQMGFS